MLFVLYFCLRGSNSNFGWCCTLQFNVKTQRPHFLDENVEALRNAGFKGIITTNNGFINLGAACHVVRLDGEHFLQGVSSAVSFQSPDFHFAKPLPTKLRLAAQRLLRDERVRPDGTSMDLVVHQMVKLQDINITHGDEAIERFARTAIIKLDLARS